MADYVIQLAVSVIGAGRAKRISNVVYRNCLWCFIIQKNLRTAKAILGLYIETLKELPVHGDAVLPVPDFFSQF